VIPTRSATSRSRISGFAAKQRQLVADLEAMVERTKGEIERLTANLAKP